MQLPRGCFRHLNGAGIETAIFSPLFARKTQGPRNLRNHRKMVDRRRRRGSGRAAEISPPNISPALKGAPPWLDLSFDLQGPVAAAAAAQFEADWVAAGGRPAALAAAQPSVACPPGTRGGRAQFLPSGPDQAEDTVHALLIDACFHVRERVLAVTPYFVPGRRLETAMRLAARRGVKIDLCIPARLESPSGGLRAQPRAARARQRRRQHPFAAVHEPCQGGGVRRVPRPVRIGQSGFAQPAAQL